MATPDEIIAANLARPKKAEVDEQIVEQFSLTQQIAASKHLAGKDLGKKKHKGLIFNVFQPPGTV